MSVKVRRGNCRVGRLAGLALALAWSLPAQAASPPDARIEAVMTALYTDPATRFWSGSDRARVRAQQLRDALENAGADGLLSEDYALPPDAADVAMTRALVRYVDDLRNGRARVRNADPDLFAHQPEKQLKEKVATVLAHPDPGAALRAQRPANSQYERLRVLLARLREDAGNAPAPAIDPGPSLKRGDTGERVVQLHARLHAAGHADTKTSGYFDDMLEAAVRAFQARHGLETDGVAGAATIEALNLPVEARIRQVVANMERWRWLPDELGAQHVLVNIAAFELTAMQHGTVALRMPVIVGRPYRRTPVFSDRIRFIELNPTWTVPVSIARKDIMPRIRKDPAHAQQEGFRIFPATSQTPIEAAEWLESPNPGSYRLVQAPGPRNALGRLKIMFPNAHDVYLHDTPTRGLFAKRVRAFSSGCIRLEQPVELAAWLLRDAGWTVARLEQRIASRRTESLKLTAHVPVHLTYATTWVDDDGHAHFRDDIYERDKLLLQALAR